MMFTLYVRIGSPFHIDYLGYILARQEQARRVSFSIVRRAGRVNSPFSVAIPGGTGYNKLKIK
jgi:hypothetical protein